MQTDLELLILLPPLTTYWDYKSVLTLPAYAVLGQALYQLSHTSCPLNRLATPTKRPGTLGSPLASSPQAFRASVFASDAGAWTKSLWSNFHPASGFPMRVEQKLTLSVLSGEPLVKRPQS